MAELPLASLENNIRSLTNKGWSLSHKVWGLVIQPPPPISLVYIIEIDMVSERVKSTAKFWSYKTILILQRCMTVAWPNHVTLVKDDVILQEFYFRQVLVLVPFSHGGGWRNIMAM